MVKFNLSRYRLFRRQLRYELLQGGLESITPTLLSGWVFLPSINLSSVKFFVGPHLVAKSFVNRARPDVEAHLGIGGCFGFEIIIPDDFPLVQFDFEPRVVATSADDIHLVNLCLLDSQRAKLTTRILQAAIHPKRRGLFGHFDGLSAMGDLLHGWSFQSGKKFISVWLHADGLPGKELSCDHHRSDIDFTCHNGNCGFIIPLCSWPEAFGRAVWVSFDEEGLLRLPQHEIVMLPSA
jgi:hypothetical protein